MAKSQQADCTIKEKSHRGNAAQFFVAGELCRRQLVAVVTMGNCPNTDILCSNMAGTHFVHVQVKTFVPGRRTCSVGTKAERDNGQRFFWVLAGIPLPGAASQDFEYYVLPSSVIALNVAADHAAWAKTPGKHGQPHDGTNTVRTMHLPPHKSRSGWSIEEYRNRWDLIVNALR
jgi:hypothetical protein